MHWTSNLVCGMLSAIVILHLVSLDVYAQSEPGHIQVAHYSGVATGMAFLELERQVSVDLQNVEVRKGLQEIAQQADLGLSLDPENPALERRVSLRVVGSVGDVVPLLLEGTGLEGLLSDTGELIVRKRFDADLPEPGAEVAEAHPVYGTVTDAETGETLPGVNILVLGTQQGVTTDPDGYYTLEVPSPSDTLLFSFVGYESQEVPINGRSEIDVALESGSLMLDEAIVVGYGVQRRSNLTGAISSVDVEHLENRPMLRLDEALQGMAAGVTVTQQGGAPGSAPTIHIRGVGSISNTEPLWVVDGVRMDSGNHLNPADIESIEILKDASASAIYGAQAAHGVILVSTKRGQGETQVNFRSSIGQRSPLDLPTLLNSEQFVHYKRESRLNAGQNPEPAWDNWEHDTDWIDAFYSGSGIMTSNNLSVSRGDDTFSFYTSFGYDHETGILIDNTLQRLTARINSDLVLTDWLEVGQSLLISRIDETPINNFNENRSGGVPYRSIPIMPIRDENNPYGGWGQGPVYFQGPNPVATQYQQHESQDEQRINGNIYVEATPIEGLVLRATAGYNSLSFLGESFHEAFNYGAFANTINSLTYTSADHETLSGTLTATYNHSFGNHDFQVLGGYEATRYDLEQFNVTGTDFPVDVAWSMNLATGSVNTTQRSNVYQSRLLSQFGRLNYNYDERYLLEANIRRDASAPKFGPENIWGIFPSFSVGWNISNEDFFQDIPFLSTVRLRASTGTLGSDNIGDYLYLRTYTSQFTSYAFDEGGQNKERGFFVSQFPNEEVKWEEVNMHNLAVDMGALDDRLTLGVDFYIKDTHDLLYGVPIPSSVGLAVHNFSPVDPQINIGSLRNTGVDIELGYRDAVGDFFLDVSGNTSFLRNEMRALDEGAYIIGGDGGGQIGGMTRTEPGIPISSFYGYVVQQILNSQQDVQAINSWAPDGIYQEAGTGPGDLMYVDINGDGQITAEHDRVVIGNPWPTMTYGLNLSVSYNEMIDLSLQLQGVYDVDIFNADKAYTRNFFGDNNTTPLISEAWRPDNHTQHPRNIASDPNGNFSNPSTYFVEDGSYLKLRNAQAGFTVPAQYVEEWGVSQLRVYVTGNNLLTLTNYSGLDPEIAGTNTSRGIDFGTYPQVRTFTGGIQLSF